MRFGIRTAIKRYFEPQALVLMYHRVALLHADIWEIAVSPENFEQQLQVLQKTRNVIPLRELVADIQNKKVKKNSVAITFDDGYADNFLVARPLLEKYKLPATFFIASGNIGASAEFWWDELEHLILFSAQLPRHFKLAISSNIVEATLENEEVLTEQLRQQHNSWNACEQAPPSHRCALFYELWQQLKPLPATTQQALLQRISLWAGVPRSVRPEYVSMTEAQVQELAGNSLFAVEAHTVSHPALAFHDSLYQQNELLRNVTYLYETTGHKPSMLAYPYGNYNNDTVKVSADAGMVAAFTTEEKLITNHSALLRLGRLQAKNQPALAFKATLKQWK